MSASLGRQNIKKTVRRSASDGRTYIYPHQLGGGPAARGREVRAQLAIAVRYFETMVGQRRLAFDSEALIALFGDPKLARGLVAAFARYYRYRRLEFADVVPVAVAEGLQDKRLGSPAALRANMFRFLNTAPRRGFAAEADRADLLAAFGADLALDPEQLADLLWLDAEENWVLTRLAVPEPADLVALYDFLALEMLLRYASKVDLIFRAPVSEAVRRDVRLLLGHYDLACDLPSDDAPVGWQLTIHGRADARGSWARHGKRLVRLLVRLLAAHPACLESGEAVVELSQSAPVLRLDSAILSRLGADFAVAFPSPAELPPVLTPAACAALRAAGLPAGWRLTVDPEPLVDSQGVLAPLALCARRGKRVYLLDVNSPAALARVERMLPHLRGRADLLLLAAPEVLAADKPLLAPHIARVPGEPLDLAAVVACLEEHWNRPVPVEAPTEAAAPISLLLSRVRRDGVVAAAEVRETLGEEPAVGPLPGGRGVEFIKDVGLCSAGFLARVREVIDEQLEFFAGRLVTLPQLTATIAANLPNADALGPAAVEALVRALPDYVVVPRKLFDPYVRPLTHITASAPRSSATIAALGRAA